MNKFFKVKVGTDYAKAVQKHFELRPKWKVVMELLSDHLGEKIERIALEPNELWLEPSDLTNEETRKLFNKNGKLKSSTKKAKVLHEAYKSIVKKVGLEHFQDLRMINFTHGVMRFQGEELSSYTDNVGMIYFKATFDLAERGRGAVEPITEIEYEETYLNLLKEQQLAKTAEGHRDDRIA